MPGTKDLPRILVKDYYLKLNVSFYTRVNYYFSTYALKYNWCLDVLHVNWIDCIPDIYTTFCPHCTRNSLWNWVWNEGRHNPLDLYNCVPTCSMHQPTVLGFPNRNGNTSIGVYLFTHGNRLLQRSCYCSDIDDYSVYLRTGMYSFRENLGECAISIHVDSHHYELVLFSSSSFYFVRTVRRIGYSILMQPCWCNTYLTIR